MLIFGSTYTTTCPVTETVTGPGTTYTKVYTTTSVVKVRNRSFRQQRPKELARATQWELQACSMETAQGGSPMCIARR